MDNKNDCTTRNKRLPVPLPQNLRGVSVAHGLGGGTSPHLCVCSEKPRRGFQSSPAPENRDRKSSVRQTLGDQPATRGHCEVADGLCTPKATTENSMEEIQWKMRNIIGSLAPSISLSQSVPSCSVSFKDLMAEPHLHSQ